MVSSTHPSVYLRGIMVGTLIVLLSGCIVIPMDYEARGSAETISDATLRKFKVGVTTRDEVLEELGRPVYFAKDGTEIRYRWSRVKGWLYIGSEYSGQTGELMRHYALTLKFDENGLFLGHELKAKWDDTSWD